MKKIRYIPQGDPKYISNMRSINQREYNNFHNKMEDFKQKAISQFKDSYKSGLSVLVRKFNN